MPDQIPLLHHDRIVGYATVDGEDYERLSRFQWFAGTGGYAQRFKREGGRNGPLRRVLARVFFNGRLHYLGMFTDEDDAADTARAFRLQHMTHAVN